MNFTDSIIILLRQNFREADRMVSVYTLEHGRMALRFPGVNKAASRLKALSEPFTHSTARIYIRRNAAIGCVTGGKIEAVYPNIRADFKKTGLALFCCELFHKLTPEHNPNQDKFLLLQTALEQLETGAYNHAFAPAFLLRLMQLSGFGLQDAPVLDIDADFWQTLHTAPLGRLNFLEEKEIAGINKARYVCQRFLNRCLDYPLNTAAQLELTAPIEIEEAIMETALEPQAV
ncbi:MAG: DNA repair protein RecO [Elusimicrobiota bacterium]|jgi:DNA repair protein RecO (recombination protein O)|nr:DNA repair protein RecO [Elusimicrobiota bacterium]